MPNAVLRTAVRKQLGLTEGEALTKEKMLELTSLRVTREYNDRSTEITNLIGLEYATNLTALEIDNTVAGDRQQKYPQRPGSPHRLDKPNGVNPVKP